MSFMNPFQGEPKTDNTDKKQTKNNNCDKDTKTACTVFERLCDISTRVVRPGET